MPPFFILGNYFEISESAPSVGLFLEVYIADGYCARTVRCGISVHFRTLWHGRNGLEVAHLERLDLWLGQGEWNTDLGSP